MGAKQKKPLITPRQPLRSQTLELVEAPDSTKEGAEREEEATPAPRKTNRPQASARRVLQRVGGEEVRPATGYLPLQLSKKVAHYCADNDIKVSEAIVIALEQLVSEA